MLDGSYTTKLSEENVLEIDNQKKQKFEPNGDLIDSYIYQLHQQERRMFPDDHSSDTGNVQINNNLDCNSIPQQIALVQVDDNNFRTAVQSLNTKQRDTFNLVCDWARKKKTLEF